MKSTVVLLLLGLLGWTPVQTARILGVLPFFPKSHHRCLHAIMKTLAEAGHEVIVYSPFPLENPPANYTHIQLENISTESEELSNFFIHVTKLPHWKCLDSTWILNDMITRELMEDKKIIELLQSNAKFDLVIVESLSMQEHTIIFGHIFQAPTIIIQTFPSNSLVNSVSGNTLAMAYMPDLCSDYSTKMSFFQRLRNSFAILRGLFYFYTWHLPRTDGRVRKYFPNMPPVADLFKNVSLMLVNDHLTADYAQPRPPNVIPVAGIHIPPEKPLPQNIKKFMDEAPEGVILFSLGTYVEDQRHPKEYFERYVNVFRQLPQRVLWKTRKENIEGLPDNVLTAKWMPQPDILAHPKCVLFITHGGHNSLTEAVHFGVPVVGIPQFFDQHRNVRFYEAKGIGVKLDPNDLTERAISTAIHTVLDNPEYRDNMKRLSRISRDTPLTPAQSVVFWTEYVIRHRGAGHLQPASTQLNWYQLYLIDVVAFVLLSLFSLVIVLYLLIKIVLSRIRGKTKQDNKKNN